MIWKQQNTLRFATIRLKWKTSLISRLQRTKLTSLILHGAIVERRFIFQTSLFAFLYNDLLLCTGHKTGFNESSLATDTSHVCNVKANVSQEHVILYISIQLILTNMHNIACCFKTVSFLFVVYLLVL